MAGSQSSDWMKILREYICRLYQSWGGDCKDLGIAPQPAIGFVVAYHAEHGAPTFSTEGDKAKFLELLDEIEAHLDSEENDLSPQDQEQLMGLLLALRNEVEP